MFIFFIGKFVFKLLFLTNDAVFKQTNEFFFVNYESLYIENFCEEKIHQITEIEDENAEEELEEEEEEENYFKKNLENNIIK